MPTRSVLTQEIAEANQQTQSAIVDGTDPLAPAYMGPVEGRGSVDR